MSVDEEESFTVRRIVETYLDSRFPADWDKKKLDDKRRGILAGWPDEVTLSRMKTGKIDVNRKTLIVLFLATDGGKEITDDWQEDVCWDEDEEESDADADLAWLLDRAVTFPHVAGMTEERKTAYQIGLLSLPSIQESRAPDLSRGLDYAIQKAEERSREAQRTLAKMPVIYEEETK